MNKKNLLLVSVSAILLYGCGSKAENTAKEVKILENSTLKIWMRLKLKRRH